MDGHEKAQFSSVETLMFVLWYTTDADVHDDHQCRVACIHLVSQVTGNQTLHSVTVTDVHDDVSSSQTQAVGRLIHVACFFFIGSPSRDGSNRCTGKSAEVMHDNVLKITLQIGSSHLLSDLWERLLSVWLRTARVKR
jgi:hypothetical protein